MLLLLLLLLLLFPSRPAVIISYLLAGFACIICALCYAEFSTETTVTGGSIVYTARTFGRFMCW
jgi:APA family basic amino acid/polyamine antiporter